MPFVTGSVVSDVIRGLRELSAPFSFLVISDVDVILRDGNRCWPCVSGIGFHCFWNLMSNVEQSPRNNYDSDSSAL